MAAIASPAAISLKSDFLGQTFAPVAAAKSTNVRAASLVVRAATKGTKKAVAKKAPTNPELAKWYGPDRRIYLPEGLLEKSDIPAYLTGEVAGDYGYDPLGLGKKPQDFAKFQANELIHARWAMLGVLGAFLPEALNIAGANCGPEAVWWKTGALLLDGGTLKYFGATIPVNLVAAVVLEAVLVGAIEKFRADNTTTDPLYPGGPFDPLGLAKDPEQFAVLKVKEIKNGRLAMFSIFGYFVQAYATGKGPVDNLLSHLSDPFSNNILSTIAGGAERLPTL
eukprot:TRINITY_DN8469_c0_g1_i1.p1 TRINITY_DN8469_c0_g1~~TRINITY_DN8469_c0_g1_i1.p1  ORF type:complete len:280 (+),score=73.85 TRINITY_DN8469_c0_g1_i1:153-992(+)